jgi:transposase
MSEQEPITSAHRADLDEVRAWLDKMIKSLRFVELVTAVIALITRMRDVNGELMKQIANLRRKRPRSEALKRLEQQLVFAFPGFANLIAKPKPESDEPPPKAEEKSRKGHHPGRAPLPAHLERVPILNPVPPELRICPKCGVEMTTVAHSICETLDIIPARLVVVQRLDETVACPKDDTIVSAPPPAQIVERGKLGTTFIIESLADKYLEHLPIERQCLRWSRAGVDVAPQTLGASVGAAIDLLQPIAKCITERTREPGLLATDATGIPVLDRDAPDGIRTGTIWCWINGKWVTFVYSPHGDSASVRVFLKDVLRPTVQCDGTSTLSFIEKEGGKRGGCWSHGRRGLVLAAKGGDLLALEGLRMIGGLFAVERMSARAGDTAEQRKARRAQYSVPILNEIRAWTDKHRKTIAPKTPLGKALGYLHRQWQRLCLFLEDGRLELTNNRVERELRKLVLGRRNWLFTWEDLGGERTATILTIIGTCVAHGINPRAYLHLVTKLLINGWPQSRLRDLLPDRITREHPQLRAPPSARPPRQQFARVDVRALPALEG